MRKKPNAIILDSWAIMSFFENERSAADVAEIIADANEAGIPLLMSVVNAGEIWYILARRASAPGADQGISSLRSAGVEFVDADWTLAREAGRIKSENKMSFADAFAAALARLRKAQLVTGDREFKQIEGEIDIRWLI
jgi:ribonuclease VapC